jgi:hypothetical protein
MTLEKIIKTLKNKEKEYKVLSNKSDYSFYEGKRRGILEAMELIGMLDKENNR